MIPTIGRIVHYRPQDWEPGDTPDAAIVINTLEPHQPGASVFLQVFSAKLGLIRALAAEGEGPGTWSWPPLTAAPAPPREPVYLDLEKMRPILHEIVKKELELAGLKDLKSLVANAIARISDEIVGKTEQS